MMEAWKPVKGYEGLYEVSNLGRVRSLDHVETNGFTEILYKGRTLKQNKNKTTGYVSVMLSKKGKVKRMYVHRIVAQAFIQNCGNLPEVNHKDQNSENNNAENLEWCDRDYNSHYGNLHEKKAISRGHAVEQYDLNMNLLHVHRSIRKAAESVGKPNGDIMVARCCKGQIESVYGYIWRYKEG